MPYNEQKGSLFYMDPDEVVKPKDEKMHKQLTVKNVQEKKLRWMTLGGQYDWTDRVYPEGQPVVFPKDLEKLIHGLVRFFTFRSMDGSHTYGVMVDRFRV